uniref:TGF-beta family profile domain-containing protein n=1 Tax=Lutzomyia longipalpis TaxID=7200 RepID=A0A1B0CN50_LUTLO
MKIVILQEAYEVPFIEIVTRDRRHRRPKRSTSLTYRENESETRCCRYPLVVDFDKFGWDWVIAPKQYDANYCSGECSINFLTRYGQARDAARQLSTGLLLTTQDSPIDAALLQSPRTDRPHNAPEHDCTDV